MVDTHAQQRLGDAFAIFERKRAHLEKRVAALSEKFALSSMNAESLFSQLKRCAHQVVQVVQTQHIATLPKTGMLRRELSRFSKQLRNAQPSLPEQQGIYEAQRREVSETLEEVAALLQNLQENLSNTLKRRVSEFTPVPAVSSAPSSPEANWTQRQREHWSTRTKCYIAHNN